MLYNTSVNNLDFPPLPNVTVDQISGFLETRLDDSGPENLSTIAHRLVLDLDDLRPMVEAVKLLGFVHLSETEVAQTSVCKAFAVATITRGKLLFRKQVIE